MEPSTNLFDLNKDQLSVITNSLKAKLKELGFSNLGFTLHKHLTLSQQQAEKQGFIVIGGLVPSSLKDNIDKLYTAMESLLNGSDAYAIEVEPGIVEGEKFPSIAELTYIPTKKKNQRFKCTPGEVVLVDFWAAWCEPSQKPMQQNQEMLERNEEKWKGKARIVGISMDDDIKSAIKRIEEKKWTKVEHYHAPEGFGLPSVRQFGIQDIPCVFLVDKRGIIRFRGSHNEINLEEKINELINEGDNVSDVEESKELKNEDTLSFDAEAELIREFQEKHEANKHLVEKIDFTSGIIAKREFKPNGQEIYTGQAMVSGLINQQDKESVIEYWKNVIQPLSKVLGFDNKLTINDVPEIKHGVACATCKKTLGEGIPHYICTACQAQGKEDFAFCLECADKEFTKEIKSGKDLFHPHGLLLLDKDSGSAVKTIKRVMNRTQMVPDTHPNFAQIKAAKNCGVRCDLCSQLPILNYRWTCANCANFDCCMNCLRILRDPSQAKHKEIVVKGGKKGHDLSHIFYRSHYLLSLHRVEPKKFVFPVSD